MVGTAEIVVEIPEDLGLEMKEIPETTLSLLASRLVKEEFEKLARLRKTVSKSELTEENALKLSTKISESMAKRYERML